MIVDDPFRASAKEDFAFKRRTIVVPAREIGGA
jgi:hypothetical protein